MSTKKVQIGARPTSTVSVDEWVKNRETALAGKESNKRLTIDVPESLHRKIKMQCAARGTKIADEVREMLLQKYGNE